MPPFGQDPFQQMFPQHQTPPFPQPSQRGFPPLFPGSPFPPPSPPPAVPPQTPGGLASMVSSLLSSGAGQNGGGLNLTGMLMNAQKAIQTAQTVLPMIQQFGPMIKSAPTILSILKTLQSSDESSQEKSSVQEREPERAKMDAVPEKRETDNLSAHAATDSDNKAVTDSRSDRRVKKAKNRQGTQQVTKPSKPRLYV